MKFSFPSVAPLSRAVLRSGIFLAASCLFVAGSAYAQGGVTNIKIAKDVSGGDPMTGTLFDVEIACTAPVYSTTVSVPAGTYVEVFDVPAPNTCTVTENPALPAPPSGYIWEAATTPPAPIPVNLVVGEERYIVVFNRLVVGVPVPTGSIEVRKQIAGGTAPGLSFDMTVECSSPAFSNTISVPAGGDFTVTGIPAPNTCSVTESASLPLPPFGFVWDEASTPPSPIAVSVEANTTRIATVTNTLRGVPPGGGGTQPTALPTLSQFALMLLGGLLMLVAGRSLKARE